MIPGSNLLAAAFMMVSPQPFGYVKYTGRAVNSIGLYESSYDAPEILSGSIQAVSRSVYQEYGLDFQKIYFTIFVSKDVVDLARDVSGDMVQWNGRVLQIVSQTPWFNIDGWVSFLAVDVGPIPAPPVHIKVFNNVFSNVFG
jgi:hypothetical protein